jgi:para-nitrobenzyl esterase
MPGVFIKEYNMPEVNRRIFLQRSFMLTSGIILTSAPVFASRRFKSDSPITNTKYGQIRGYTDNGINVFKGIPYGANTSIRRFMPPLPPEPWKEIREAVEYGPSCPQQSRGGEKMSEDCLVLNVFAPALRDNGKRPVMFYIHGGAYSGGSGSSPLYDGVNLCKRGNVVVVSVNHRLNAFGYLYLSKFGGKEFADSGNVGQLDLILALQWVRDNITEFGGDPNSIMVFGQSGGGAKIATMMAMPAANDLFHRAATMSGQQITASGPLNATLRTQGILDALKISSKNIDDIRTMPFEKIVDALSTKDPVLPFGSVYFGPVLDERWLMRHPFYPDAPAQSANISMIIGNTHDETRAFLGGDSTNFTLTWKQLPEKLIPNMRVDIKPEYVIAEYRKLYPDLSASDLFFRITTASRSWRGAIIEAEERAKSGSPAYAYQLDWATPKYDGKFGAPHASDIQLVFDNIDKPGATAIGPQAQQMADIMSETFIAFARTGNPNNKLIPDWEKYLMEKRETMVFNVPPYLENDPRGAERKIFEMVPYIQAGS